MLYSDLNTYNWKVIQAYYDNNHTFKDVMVKFSFSTCKLSEAKKRGLIITRSRNTTRVLTGRNHNLHTQETKDKISKSMLKAVREGRQKTPIPYGTRCRHIKYICKDKSIVHLLGSWEELVAKFLDKNNIEWTRPKTGHRYIYNDKEHYYFPDFYLPFIKTYIEVKGYETARDREKWSQFPSKLVIINKHNIFNLNQFFNNLVL